MRLRMDVGRAFRLAWRAAGLSQEAVSRLAGVSQTIVSRIERGRAAADIVKLTAIAEVVGLKLAVNIFPGGAAVRDAGHIRLIARLRAALPASFVWATERVMPVIGDLRSIDAVIVRPSLGTGFELESRLTDA